MRNFDVCIVAIGDNFQSSLETTSLLKELGAGYVVSRAAMGRPGQIPFEEWSGRGGVPENSWLPGPAIRYSADHIFDYVELDEEHAIFEVAVPEGWAEKTIGQLNVRRKYNINIMALKHDGKMKLNISPDTVLPAEDTMLVLGNIRDIQRCFHI